MTVVPKAIRKSRKFLATTVAGLPARLRARYAADRPKSNFAQITSALIALIALVAIYLQVDAGRKNALRSSARQVYLFYSGLLMQYPHLAVPDYARIMNDPDQTDRIRYELMMSNMLTAYDEILNADSGADWVAAFKFDLQIHIAYFCALTDPLYYAQFSKVALKVVAKEKAKRWCIAAAAPKPSSDERAAPSHTMIGSGIGLTSSI